MTNRLADPSYDQLRFISEACEVVPHKHHRDLNQLVKHHHPELNPAQALIHRFKIRNFMKDVPLEFFNAKVWKHHDYKELLISHVPASHKHHARDGWLFRFPCPVWRGDTTYSVYLRVKDVILPQVLDYHLSPDLAWQSMTAFDNYFRKDINNHMEELFDDEMTQAEEVFHFHVYERVLPDAMGRSPSNTYYTHGSPGFSAINDQAVNPYDTLAYLL